MRVLVWNVHTGWLDAFVRGPHEYLLPVDEHGAGSRGVRPWPPGVRDVAYADLRGTEVDVVVLQRLEELELVEDLLGRRPGRDLPAVFVEHNTPREDVPESVHPLADRDDILIAHVTHFNSLFWDTGRAPTVAIEHGIVDPGPLYTGELARIGVVINEPVRRWRVTGSDLLGGFSTAAPVDVFGMKAHGLAERLGVPGDRVVAAGDLPTDVLHAELARRRLYLHPVRWTSLGLSLLEAMHLGMPVVALDSTEVRRAVPPEAGVVSSRLDELQQGVRMLLADPEAARAAGIAARRSALAHYGLDRFLGEWTEALSAAMAGRANAGVGSRREESTMDDTTTGEDPTVDREEELTMAEASPTPGQEAVIMPVPDTGTAEDAEDPDAGGDDRAADDRAPDDRAPDDRADAV